MMNMDNLPLWGGSSDKQEGYTIELHRTDYVNCITRVHTSKERRLQAKHKLTDQE